MIAQLRAKHTELAGVSDEQILTMLEQARSQPPAQGSVQDLDKMGANECGVLGEQLLQTGRWDEAERCFLAALEKSEQAGDLSEQADAAMHLGRLCGRRGDSQQAMTLFQQSLGLAERLGDRLPA